MHDPYKHRWTLNNVTRLKKKKQKFAEDTITIILLFSDQMEREKCQKDANASWAKGTYFLRLKIRCYRMNHIISQIDLFGMEGLYISGSSTSDLNHTLSRHRRVASMQPLKSGSIDGGRDEFIGEEEPAYKEPSIFIKPPSIVARHRFILSQLLASRIFEREGE